MVVESAFLYSAFALLFLVPFAVGHPIQNAFVQLLGEIQVCPSHRTQLSEYVGQVVHS